MDIQYFVEKFAEQFDETDIGCFSPKTVFKELDEWSSLIALTLIAMIDEEYDVNSEIDKHQWADVVIVQTRHCFYRQRSGYGTRFSLQRTHRNTHSTTR